ncbi:MAG: hypothetical protein HY235_03715 [Acidobacteria bacterium]|nr:hypothetical protein [Acidobacteriota bacterium]
MEQSVNPAPNVDPPLGFWPAKVDDKGRLKLPVNFASYLTALQATKVFITTLDKVTGKIYTIPTWNGNVKLLDAPGPKRQWGKDLVTVANKYGADGELDANGRLVLPTEMRRTLGLENSQVWLSAGDGVITIREQKVHEAVCSSAEQNLAEKVGHFEETGLK